ncbi:hypothetical protein [Gordonibacter urolithinfaciens]|uniref:hypothetical protein n=1 Tax=Gordonibacter urolithinfaciens TaxID=1335613 RepID=UPI003A92AACC
MTTNLTKGKKRLTLELKPSTLDLLEGYSNRVEISRGQAIDDLTEKFVGMNPKIAGAMYATCIQKASEASLSAARAKDGIALHEAEQLRSEYLNLADHFSVLATAQPSSTTDLAEVGFKTILLSRGNKEIVPQEMHLINPADEGSGDYLYQSWYMNPSEPCDQMQAWRGEAPGGLFGFISKRDDLHLFGQETPALFKNETEHDKCAAEAQKLIGFMVANSKRVFSEYAFDRLQFAWALVSTLGTAQSKIGLSFAYERR